MATPLIAKAESDASMRAGFSWTFPGAPIRINIPLPLIARLRAELDQEQSAGNLSSTELGGILLGYPKDLTTVEIDDYLWVASNRPADSQYSLDISILERLRSEYGARPGNGGRQPLVVGYFRTQAKDHLRLRNEETGLVREHFHDPANVVLLILTSTRPPTAGYFFWMEKDVFAPVSFKDFPLDAKVLLPTQPHSTDIPAAHPVGEEKMAMQVPAMARENAPAAGSEPANTSRTATANKKEPKRISPRKMAAIGALCAALVLASLSPFMFRERRPSRPTPQPAPVTTLPLQLEVEAQGNGLNVRWNPQSSPVLQGREGHLAILEGNRQPQVIQLDSQQLTSGHVYYRSAAERIQFQLEIVDQSGKVFRESVLALSSNPAPSATPIPSSQPGNGQSQTRIVTSIPIPSSADAETVRPGSAEGVQKSPSPSAPRAFVPPTGSAPAARIPAIVLDQPPAVASDTSLPLTAGLPAALNRLPPPPPQNGPRATQPTKMGGNVQGATLIKRVEPIYPPIAVTGHIEGTVRFSVVIGKDGTVRSLQAISGTPVFIQAASDAVKQWIYRPFLLDGQPVEGVTQLDVHFTLRR